MIILGDSAPRDTWLTGKIAETIPDKRGLVHHVKIKTATGFLNRPISKLCLLLESEEL